MPEEIKFPDNIDDKGAEVKDGDKPTKVVVDGRKFDSYEDAATKMSESYKEAQVTLTKAEQEKATVKKELEEAEEKLLVLQESVKTEEPPEGDAEYDFQNPKGSTEKIATKVSKKIVDEALAKQKEETKTEIDKLEGKLRDAEGHRLIAQAQVRIPELNKDEVLKGVQKVLAHDPQLELVRDVMKSQHPKVFRKTASNPMELVYFYIQHINGKLKEGEIPAELEIPYTEGGSSSEPPKSDEVSDKDFFKMSTKEQDAVMEKQALEQAKKAGIVG